MWQPRYIYCQDAAAATKDYVRPCTMQIKCLCVYLVQNLNCLISYDLFLIVDHTY